MKGIAGAEALEAKDFQGVPLGFGRLQEYDISNRTPDTRYLPNQTCKSRIAKPAQT